MTWRVLPTYVFDTIFRMFPHRAPTGLIRIGNPRRDSPVLVTGNYTLTVRRVREALAGEDVWLLVCNSNGINVWCAAGGGHLTHHDVISAIRISGIGELVDHRKLVLPQLGATGIERRKVADATGWVATWGPARLEDLQNYVRRRGGVRKDERKMRFPLWERLEMALVWALPITLVGAPLFGLFGGWPVGIAAVALVPLMCFGLFAALPWLRVTGHIRWVTFGFVALLGFAAGSGVLATLGSASSTRCLLVGGAAVSAMGILSIDLAGTTPWYGSYINTYRNFASIELVPDRCTGAADCVQVCPRDVLRMKGAQRKVQVLHPRDCIQCGACIVQCPSDALRFRYTDGRIVEPATIRRTRMNMIGARTIEVDSETRTG
jgi:NAD-dependent dihydropyrimidine dehydrogenase PreA subunit